MTRSMARMATLALAIPCALSSVQLLAQPSASPTTSSSSVSTMSITGTDPEPRTQVIVEVILIVLHLA